MNKITRELTKTLKPCSDDEELSEALKYVESDENMADLGFECKGQLINYSGFENFSERLWVCTKENDDNTLNIVVTGDAGNGWCNVVYTDMYIKELLS